MARPSSSTSALGEMLCRCSLYRRGAECIGHIGHTGSQWWTATAEAFVTGAQINYNAWSCIRSRKNNNKTK